MICEYGKLEYNKVHIIRDGEGSYYDKLKMFKECTDDVQYLYFDLDIIIKGDRAKPSDPAIGVKNCLSPFCGQQNNVSAIINIKNSDPKDEGSLAERVPKLSQISIFGNE